MAQLNPRRGARSARRVLLDLAGIAGICALTACTDTEQPVGASGTAGTMSAASSGSGGLTPIGGHGASPSAAGASGTAGTMSAASGGSGGLTPIGGYGGIGYTNGSGAISADWPGTEPGMALSEWLDLSCADRARPDVLASVELAQAVDFIGLYRATSLGLAEDATRGEACSDASDAAACASELDAHKPEPEACDEVCRAVVTTRGDTVVDITDHTALAELLGSIDSADEAAIAAWLGGIDLRCDTRTRRAEHGIEVQNIDSASLSPCGTVPLRVVTALVLPDGRTRVQVEDLPVECI